MAVSQRQHAAGQGAGIPPPVIIAGLIALVGLLGLLGPAWGYGLFATATALLLSGVVLGCVLVLSSRFDGERLQRATGGAFWLGAWCYVFAVAALGGYYGYETIEGRMAWKWIVFGPSALAAIVILDWGLYRILYKRNEATLARFGDVIERKRIDRPALRKTFVDEIVVHRTLLALSPFRWVRHQLILWGFALMFGFEIGAVFLREVFPALGLVDLWHAQGHPVRLIWDAAFDITGLMILVGCLLAILYRIRVHGTPEQRFTDTPTAVFLLAVVLTGFAVEGLRLAAAPPSPDHAASPVGLVFAVALSPLVPLSNAASDALWVFHALLSCAFIAYVPLKRLVHSCATPIGRLMNSQKSMLAAKKDRVMRGLLVRRPPD